MIKTKVKYFDCFTLMFEENVNKWIEAENVCITNITNLGASEYAIRVLIVNKNIIKYYFKKQSLI